jgi:PAS domain S-box-containing protein
VSRSPFADAKEQRYRAVVESQVEMVCRFRRDGTILFVNAAYARARGTTADALTGANFWDFIPEGEHQAVGELLDSLSQGRPEVRIENPFATTAGVRWTLWANRALTFDEHGRPTEFQSSGLDITDRKRAEEALRESEARYRYIFATAGVSIWDEDFSEVKTALDDLRGQGIADFAEYFRAHPEWVDRAIGLVRVREVNPATLRMLAARSQREVMDALNTIVLPATRDVFVAELQAIADGQRSFHAETVLNTLDGRARDVLITIAFPAPHESFASVLVTLTDITEQKQIEEHLRETANQLEQSNRLKDEFLATLSHELRTPLNAVLGWAHMLRSGSLRPDVQERALESLERNARAQSQLIDDLLDMSRIVSGRLQIALDPVELSTVLSAAIDTVRPTAASKGVELHVSTVASQALCVRGDADRLHQILWNLLANAIKFTPGGGRVDLALRGDATHAEIIVRDSGEGIDPSFLPYVFERFRQADATSTRRHGGLGLGLSIARHLAEAHGGTITAQSEGRHQGATFTLRLPRDLTTTGSASGAPAGAADTPLAGTSILVVDDDPDARELFRVALELAGAEVVVRGAAREALDYLRERRVDLLIADIAMPDHDGFELIRHVRALPAPLGRLPAIAVTAYSMQRERDEAFAAGFNAHAAKPMEVERLLAAVVEVLRARH